MLRIISFLIVFATISGCAVVRGERSVEQYADDAAVTANVKSELIRSDEVSASRVTVETDKGTVLLSGFVKNEAQKLAAQRIAESVSGVKVVKNNLLIS